MANCERLCASIDEHVANNKTAFGTMTITHDPIYDALLDAIDIIKVFIRTHQFILYGGIAIDYAMRLRGERLYSDEEFPDFDFWSPTHLETAQELIELLTARITTSIETKVRGVNAMFLHTMRITIGNNNWVADITYMPPALYEKIPTLSHNGMRFVHPHFQFADLHSSMTFPYDNAPREVIFARCNKDIKRYNQLYTLYPIEHKECCKVEAVQVEHDLVSHSILAGFAAYAFYYNIFRDTGLPIPSWMPTARPIRAQGSDSIIVDVPYNLVEFYTHSDALAKYVDIDGHTIRKFAPVLNLNEPAQVLIEENRTIIAYSSKDRLISYNSFQLNRGNKIRAVAMSAILKHFIGTYMRLKHLQIPMYGARNNGTASLVLLSDNPDIFITYYCACLHMIEAVFNARLDAKTMSLFMPAINVFGSNNVAIVDRIGLRRMIIRALNIADDNLVLPPANLKASAPNTPRMKPFAYDKCILLKISGEEILTSI